MEIKIFATCFGIYFMKFAIINAVQTAYNKIFETEKENETEIQLCNK